MTSLDYYANEDLLTDDERAARDRARRFVQEEVVHEIVPSIARPNYLQICSARRWTGCGNCGMRRRIRSLQVPFQRS